MNDDPGQKLTEKNVRAAGRLFARPVYLFAITLFSIFLSEAFVMLILSDLQTFSLPELALLDASILTMTLFPILYLFIFRPMKNHLEQRKQLELYLQNARNELELRVKERTAELNRRTGQLARLSSQLTVAEERERHRIAGILHDDLQQLLVAARMNLDAADKNPKDQATLNERIRALIQESIDASRSLAVELSPPLLYKRGLSAALEWLARSFREKHRLAIELQIDPQADPEQEEVLVLLFASIRELLFNVVKHAKAGAASVRMGRDEKGRLTIAVGDDGVGFDTRQIMTRRSLSGGFGLFTIQERLELMGGSLRVDSAPGKGSLFTMIVPIQKKKDSIEDASRLADR